MRFSVRIVLIGAFSVSLLPIVGAPFAQASTLNFPRTLRLGSTGEDVRALQQLLNADPSTAIRGSGVGTKGRETIYFGMLTRDAVIRFQEKYAALILAPVGLVAGTGIVGPSTRAYLTEVSQTIAETSSGSSPKEPAAAKSQPNPNLEHISVLLSALDRVGAKQGLSSTTVALAKAKALEIMATSTDLRAAFVKKVAQDRAQTNGMTAHDIIAVARDFFTSIFTPARAYAATGLPFGGMLLEAMPCACSDTWLLTLEPLPPDYVALLTYVPGTQAFAGYNIPATLWLLGNYEPGAGVCFVPGIPCFPIPSEGMITPEVGSSPL